MTEEITETEATETTQTDEQPKDEQQPIEATEPGTDDPDAEQDTEDSDDTEQEGEPEENPALKKARRDAAKYRERLRETEAQLAALENGLDNARRQVLWDHHQPLLNGYVIGGNKYSIIPSAINDVLGDNVAQFFDPETGGLNQDAYRQHLQTMMETKPHYFATNTELTQMELDSKVKTMIQETGRSRDRFQNAVMGKQNY